ncbi:unnamed protein product [Ceutorhynchus assimilis]|uniref:Uncharacterized protein n=1 Tax=Ceutorhynchus assimilis TaxID=467358 RepID=A0A9N9MT71_9CUCU|nr:unnamed protein product [Ceutorhynchus assimilis]
MVIFDSFSKAKLKFINACSLPSNVNSGDSSREFLEEAKRSKEMKEKELALVDMEKERLIENDLLARGYDERLIDGSGPSRGGSSTPQESHIATAIPKYTSKATLHIQSNRASNVDDPVSLGPLDLDTPVADKKYIDANTLAKVVQHSKYQVIIPTYPAKPTSVEEKKVDENGNALHQTKEKKKKKQSDKNVTVLSQNIEGHRSEIINNVDQLLHFIEGTTENNLKSRPVQSKSKQLHKQHTTEEGGSKTGKRRHKSGTKENESGNDGRHELKKSNSLSEISGMKLDREFEAFGKNKPEKDEENVVLRGNKPMDRTRERRSWGNVEPHSFQTLYNASSLENLETATDSNWEVTRPKKKSKKRRNSVSSATGGRQHSSASGVSSLVSNEDRRSRRAPSPDLGVVIVGVSNAKTTRSMPHSEKSNDSSSDVDSVHSLPLDGPISYADIAKNSEKKKPSPEKQERSIINNKEKSPQLSKHHEPDSKNIAQTQLTNSIEKPINLSSSSSSINPTVAKPIVLDVNNIKSFPAITSSTTKTTAVAVSTTAQTQTSDKAVQSTLGYEDNFVREKTFSGDTQKADNGLEVSSLKQQRPAMPINNNNSNVNNNVGKDRKNKNSEATQQTNSVQGFFGVQGDVHNELSSVPTHIHNLSEQQAQPQPRSFEKKNTPINHFEPTHSTLFQFLSQLMRDPANYATQRMPPDIVDVSTIEKMQFMQCIPITCNSSSHNDSTQVSYTQSYPSAPSDAVPIAHQGGSKSKRKKGNNPAKTNHLGDSKVNNEVADENDVVVVAPLMASVCDTNNAEEKGVRMVNGVSDEISFSSPEPRQHSIADEPMDMSSSPPPVVILSGLPKEVPSGLIFGFDVNEQLLLEDSGGCDAITMQQQQSLSHGTVKITEVRIERLPCRGDEWVKCYKPPANDRGAPKHNHDKIVSFISAAWESVLSQQIQYYSDGL